MQIMERHEKQRMTIISLILNKHNHSIRTVHNYSNNLQDGSFIFYFQFFTFTEPFQERLLKDK